MSPKAPRSLRSFALLAATCAVFAVGAVRIGILVLHEPMLGYANNYDFIKLSSTVGMWVDEPGADPLAGHPSDPYRHYRTHGNTRPGLRHLSSELLLLVPAIAVGDLLAALHLVPAHSFDLRILGTWKWIVFSAAGTFLTVLFFRRSAWLGLASALVFAVLIADPINTLYFNTLYFDDSAVLFTWIAMGCALLLAPRDESHPGLMGLFCAALFCATVSKVQHSGLALAIVLAFAIARWSPLRRERKAFVRKLAAPVAAALVALVAGLLNLQSRGLRGSVLAGSTNVWFLTVLPVVRDPRAVLSAHGIPDRCFAYVGKSWFDPGMQPPPCPEIFRLSRFTAVSTLLEEPPALLRLLARGAAGSRPLLVPYGHVEGRPDRTIGQQGPQFASLWQFVDHLDLPVFLLLLAFAAAGGVAAILVLVAGRGPPAAALVLFANAVWGSTFVASLLGDGWVDFARHLHLAQNAYLVAGGATAAMIVQFLLKPLRSTAMLRTALPPVDASGR